MANAGDSDSQLKENLLKAEESVKELYNYNKNFFSYHELEKASERKKLVNDKLSKTVELLRSLQKSLGHLADYHLLLGRSYNVLESFHQEAYTNLARAVKLDPKLTAAWTELGECYWKKGEVSAAHNCFLGALKHGPDKVALRSLSMAIRQLPGKPEEQPKRIQESVDKAKEAVTIDMNDGMSWFILGNAYLAQFFNGGQDPRVLQQCTAAYEKAIRDKSCQHYPDLHFNRAVVHKYKEEYLAALEDFSTASKLDPEWPEPTAKLAGLIKYLSDMQQLLANKGRVKTKKIQSWTSKLGDQELGPYAGGNYTSPKNDKITLEVTAFSNLTAGLNEHKVIVGRLLGFIITEEKTPFVFGLVDSAGSCTIVTVYNIIPNSTMKVGDSVAIPEPYYENINFSFGEKSWNFPSIRVMHPTVLVVNGKKLGSEYIALTSFSSDVQSQ